MLQGQGPALRQAIGDQLSEVSFRMTAVNVGLISMVVRGEL